MPARKWLTPIFQSLLTTSFSLLQSKYLQSYFILPISPLGVPNFSLKLFFEFATKFSVFSFFPLSSLARDRSYFFFSAASGSILCSKEIAARKTRLPRSTIVPPWLSMNFHCRDFFRVLSWSISRGFSRDKTSPYGLDRRRNENIGRFDAYCIRLPSNTTLPLSILSRLSESIFGFQTDNFETQVVKPFHETRILAFLH